jgi:hypothetical protein
MDIKPEENENQEEKVSTNSLDSFIDDMIEKQPEVQQHVVDAERARTEVNATATDSTGETFNPDIHIEKDGKPSVTKTGKFRKRKGVVDPRIAQQKEEEKKNEHLESQASAELVQGLKRQVYNGFFDYTYSDERHGLHVEATKEYFISEGGIKLTPLQNLLILEGFLGLEVMRTEKGVKRLTGLKAWAASKWVKFKGKKHGTQSSPRSNDVGKNNASKENAESGKGKDRAPAVSS